MKSWDSDLNDREEVSGVVIDPPTFDDHDDAWDIKRTSDGGYLVQISTPELSDHCEPLSTIDQNAFTKCFSRYYLDHADFMLPQSICEDSGSLLFDQPRKAITIEVPIGSNWEIGFPTVKQTIFKSRGNFTYEDALFALADELDPDHQSLADAELIANHLHQQRHNRALPYFKEELELFGEDSIDENNPVYLINSEMMILANQSIARFAKHFGFPFLFRNHSFEMDAVECERLLRLWSEKQLGTRERRDFSNLIFSQAYYSPMSEGHFGLNLPEYAHITSPLRRYTDLVNQRQLISWLSHESLSYSQEDLQTMAEHINRVEDQIKQRDPRQSQPEVSIPIARRQKTPPKKKQPAEKRQSISEMIWQQAKQGELDQNLERAILKHLQSTRVTTREIFAILMVAPQNQAWNRLKTESLAWLKSNPKGINGVFTHAFGMDMCKNPRLLLLDESTKHTKKHIAVAKIEVNGATVVSRPIIEADSESSRCGALRSLLLRILGYDKEVINDEIIRKLLKKKGVLISSQRLNEL